MSAENDRLGQPLPFTFEGQALPLSVCTGDVEILFTAWLESHAREKIARKKKDLGDEYGMHLRIWQQKVETEEYEWTGYTSLMVRASDTGKRKLLELLMGAAGSRPTPTQLDRIFRCPEKVVELFNEDVGDDKPPLGLYWKAIACGRPTVPVQKTAGPAATSN